MKKKSSKNPVALKERDVTRGSVFNDLDFSTEEAAVLKLKADLHSEIISIVVTRNLTPRSLEKILGQPQPRISELLCGKISKISAEKLVSYLSRLKVPIEISTGSGRVRGKISPVSIFPAQDNSFECANETTKTIPSVGEPVEHITNSGSVTCGVLRIDAFRNRKEAV